VDQGFRWVFVSSSRRPSDPSSLHIISSLGTESPSDEQTNGTTIFVNTLNAVQAYSERVQQNCAGAKVLAESVWQRHWQVPPSSKLNDLGTRLCTIAIDAQVDCSNMTTEVIITCPDTHTMYICLCSMTYHDKRLHRATENATMVTC
jgi:hypothetical protein